MKKFINHLVLKYNVVFNWLHEFHNRLLETTESQTYDIWKANDKNLYMVFLSWLLETLMYGLVLSIGLISVSVRWRWFHPITHGLMIWVSMELINQIAKAIRRK